jgi:hypothetical protein
MNDLARRIVIAVAAVAPLLCAPKSVRSQTPATQRVSRQQLVEAMSLQKDFEITATTNGARFHAGVIFQLAQWARERSPDGPPLFIDYEDTFEAYLRVARRARDQAPAFVRKAYDHRQGQIIEYRDGAVIDNVESAPAIEQAVAVTASWPDTRDLPGRFSYLDVYSVPNLRVTNQRIVRYKLVKFRDARGFILTDQISGVSGKPTTGFLGALFQVLGDSQVLQSRSAISSDGLQIVQAHARWFLVNKKLIVTIQKDGRAEAGIDPTRRDLQEIERLITQDLRIRYRER